MQYCNIKLLDSQKIVVHLWSNLKQKKMEQSVLDMISLNSIYFFYDGWRNGKSGSITQKMDIYRFYEKCPDRDDIKYVKDEDNPIVAKGIVSYWLRFNSRANNTLKKLTIYREKIPETIKEQFDNYTQMRFEQFKAEHRDDPDAWDWDWDYEFYAKTIIPHEMKFNKESEALFAYISDDDVKLVRSVMVNYIKYLKKCRSDRGYNVSPELMVLRAIAFQDDTMLEDLEDFEVRTILKDLADRGFIQVAWIEGGRSEGERLLDRGWVYMKQLENNRSEIKVDFVDKPLYTHEEEFESETEDIEQPSNINKGIQHLKPIKENWDDSYDYIFDERVKPWEIKKALEDIDMPQKISKKRFYYVTFRVLKVLKYLNNKTTGPDFMRWVNIHFNCGWIDDNQHRKQFAFALEGSSRNLENQDPSEWDENTIKGGSGKYHHELAIQLKNTFTKTMINGDAIDDSDSFEHLKDRTMFLRQSTHLRDDDYYALENAFINKG